MDVHCSVLTQFPHEVVPFRIVYLKTIERTVTFRVTMNRMYLFGRNEMGEYYIESNRMDVISIIFEYPSTYLNEPTKFSTSHYM